MSDRYDEVFDDITEELPVMDNDPVPRSKRHRKEKAGVLAALAAWLKAKLWPPVWLVIPAVVLAVLLGITIAENFVPAADDTAQQPYDESLAEPQPPAAPNETSSPVTPNDSAPAPMSPTGYSIETESAVAADEGFLVDVTPNEEGWTSIVICAQDPNGDVYEWEAGYDGAVSISFPGGTAVGSWTFWARVHYGDDLVYEGSGSRSRDRAVVSVYEAEDAFEALSLTGYTIESDKNAVELNDVFTVTVLPNEAGWSAVTLHAVDPKGSVWDFELGGDQSGTITAASLGTWSFYADVYYPSGSFYGTPAGTLVTYVTVCEEGQEPVAADPGSVVVPTGYSIELSADSIGIGEELGVYVQPNEGGWKRIVVHAVDPEGNVWDFDTDGNTDVYITINEPLLAGVWTFFADVYYESTSFIGGIAEELVAYLDVK